MSEAAEDRFHGLIEIAERQQAAVQTALEGLTAQRAALAYGREQLAQGVSTISRHVCDTVRMTVSEGIAGAAETGTVAVERATVPLLRDLAGVGCRDRCAGAVLVAENQRHRRAGRPARSTRHRARASALSSRIFLNLSIWLSHRPRY